MDTKDVLYRLRTGKGLSQEELAEKLFVTRQAVSRWETGETTPPCRDLKAAFSAVRCVDQHPARGAAAAYLPMLRDAARGRRHEPGTRRRVQRGVL